MGDLIIGSQPTTFNRRDSNSHPVPIVERRLHHRYTISLRCTLVRSSRNSPAEMPLTGTIRDIGSGCVCLTSDCIGHSSHLTPGKTVEISIDWPVRLQRVGLQLRCRGRICRNDAEGIAIEFKSYEFRTRKS